MILHHCSFYWRASTAILAQLKSDALFKAYTDDVERAFGVLEDHVSPTTLSQADVNDALQSNDTRGIGAGKPLPFIV